MSNKLVKKAKEVEEKVPVKEEVKLNIKDLLLFLLLGALGVVRYMYLDIPEFINLGNVFNTVAMVVSLVGFVVIAMVCGSYQSKQQGDNITVASVLKGKHRVIYTPTEKIINGVNSLLRTTVIALAGCLLNTSLGLIALVVGTTVVIVATPKNKFKTMDIGYTIYTVGMLAVIFSMLRV